MVEAPIFHCNGDDPEAVTFAAKIAVEYRQKFGKPVVIDMLCYRRFGHNEGDEPAFTQPKMYQRIRKHPTVLETYGRKLVENTTLSQEALDARKAEFRSMLDSEFDIATNYKANKADWLDGRWSGVKAVHEDVDDPRRGRTAVPAETIQEIARKITQAPPGFHLHRTIQRFMDNRAKAVETGAGIDWATAEALAFGATRKEAMLKTAWRHPMTSNPTHVQERHRARLATSSPTGSLRATARPDAAVSPASTSLRLIASHEQRQAR